MKGWLEWTVSKPARRLNVFVLTYSSSTTYQQLPVTSVELYSRKIHLNPDATPKLMISRIQTAAR